jgi:putative transposase
MPRVPRTALPDGFFHVYTRGVAASTPFPEDQDKGTMMELIPSLEWRHGLTLHVACVMSTHYHTVVEGTCEALSPAMHWLNWAYARYYNEKYGLYGHVFAERFQTRVIEDEDGVRGACDYVLLNPVKAGLCECVEDWPWSYSRWGPTRLWC